MKLVHLTRGIVLFAQHLDCSDAICEIDSPICKPDSFLIMEAFVIDFIQKVWVVLLV